MTSPHLTTMEWYSWSPIGSPVTSKSILPEIRSAT